MRARSASCGLLVPALALIAGCHDLSTFSTASGGAYEGPILSAGFVRAGLPASARMCLTIDTTHLQDNPGVLSTRDGLFHSTPLRTIPQLWQDPLSTLSFGDGRIQNAIYVAHGNAGDAGPEGDVTVVVSFMTTGDVEVRLLRGAPPAAAPGSEPATPMALFGVFTLSRTDAACSY